jgi:hypothetical protein
MLFFVTKRVMSFLRVAVTDRRAQAVHIMLPGNREPEVLSRPCTFTSDPIRERIQ